MEELLDELFAESPFVFIPQESIIGGGLRECPFCYNESVMGEHYDDCIWRRIERLRNG